jgi:hypothetical protein
MRHLVCIVGFIGMAADDDRVCHVTRSRRPAHGGIGVLWRLFSLVAFSTIFVKRVATVDDRNIGSIPEEFRKSHRLASGKPGFALLDYSLAIPSSSLHLRVDE